MPYPTARAIDQETLEKFQVSAEKNKSIWPTELLNLLKKIEASQPLCKAFVVGGFIRDTLRGSKHYSDIDILLLSSSENFSIDTLKEHFSTLQATGRKGLYRASFELDKKITPIDLQVKKISNLKYIDRILKADATKRDFTINSLYLDNTGTLLDPLNIGKKDLEEKKLNCSGSVMQFLKDPTRLLRLALYGCVYKDLQSPLFEEIPNFLTENPLDIFVQALGIASTNRLPLDNVYKPFNRYLKEILKKDISIIEFIKAVFRLNAFPHLLPSEANYQALNKSDRKKILSNFYEKLSELQRKAQDNFDVYLHEIYAICLAQKIAVENCFTERTDGTCEKAEFFARNACNINPDLQETLGQNSWYFLSDQAFSIYKEMNLMPENITAPALQTMLQTSESPVSTLNPEAPSFQYSQPVLSPF